MERMAALIVRLALGQEPKAVARAHAAGEILAIAKTDGGMRPLIMHSIHRRIGLGAVARATQAEIMAASGVHQLGIGARDGCVKAFHATAALVELNPGKPIMSCDISAAHQSLDQAWMMQEVHDLCPVLERPLAVWYTPVTNQPPNGGGRRTGRSWTSPRATARTRGAPWRAQPTASPPRDRRNAPSRL